MPLPPSLTTAFNPQPAGVPDYLRQLPEAELRAMLGQAMRPGYTGLYSPVQIRGALSARPPAEPPMPRIEPGMSGNPEDYALPPVRPAPTAALPAIEMPPELMPLAPQPQAATPPGAPRAARRAAAPMPSSVQPPAPSGVTPAQRQAMEVDAAMPAGDPTATSPTQMPQGLTPSQQNKWLAVMTAGLGMLGQEGGTALGNIGKGALVGVQSYQNWEKDRKQDEQRTRSLDITEKYREDQARIGQQNANTRFTQIEAQIAQREAALARGIGGFEAARARSEIERLGIEQRDEESRRTAALRSEQQDPLRRAADTYSTEAAALRRSFSVPQGPTNAIPAPEEINRRVQAILGPPPPRFVDPSDRAQFKELYDRFNSGQLPRPALDEGLRRLREKYPGLSDPMLLLRQGVDLPPPR